MLLTQEQYEKRSFQRRKFCNFSIEPLQKHLRSFLKCSPFVICIVDLLELWQVDVVSVFAVRNTRYQPTVVLVEGHAGMEKYRFLTIWCTGCRRARGFSSCWRARGFFSCWRTLILFSEILLHDFIFLCFPLIVFCGATVDGRKFASKLTTVDLLKFFCYLDLLKFFWYLDPLKLFCYLDLLDCFMRISC